MIRSAFILTLLAASVFADEPMTPNLPLTPERAAQEAKLLALLYERNVQPIMPTCTNSTGMKFR
ncbi:MAG: hypothetical protein N2C14_01590 [Planctomycetales bacterium]